MTTFNVGAIRGRMHLDLDQWGTSVEKVKGDSRGIQGSLSDIGSKAIEVGRSLALIGTGITGIFGLTLKVAAEVEEAENLFTVSMGNMADATRAWSEQLSDSVGVSAASIRNITGNLNVIVKNFGLTETAAASMSKEMTKLALDMSSFYNLSHEEALGKLRSGIVGETEPLKALGIVLSEATVKAFAFENGIASVGSELSEAQKIVARYGLILKLTQDAQGDLARTGGSLTNQTRRLSDEIRELSASVGKILSPAMTDVIGKANRAIGVFKDWATENAGAADSLVKFAAGTGVTLAGLGSLTLGIGVAIKAYSTLRTVAVTAWAAAAAPATLVIAAIGALGAALYALRAVWKQNFQEIRDIADEKFASIRAIFDSLVAKAQEVVGKVRAIFGRIANIVNDVLPSPIKIGAQMFGVDKDSIAGGIDAVRNAVDKGVDIATSRMRERNADLRMAIGGMITNVVDQFKADFGSAIPESLKSLMGQITGAVEVPGFEGYKAPDFAALMQGAEGAESLAASAKKAAEELEKLKGEAESMRLELYPAEALRADIANLTGLAEQFPSIIDAAAISRAGTKAFDDFTSRGMTAAEIVSVSMKSAPAAFVRGIETAINKAEALARINEDAAKWLETQESLRDSIVRGVGLADTLTGEGLVKQLTTDMEDLKNAGRVDGETLNLLAVDYWEQLSRYSEDAAARIVDALLVVEPQLAETFKRIRKETSAEKAVDMFREVGNVAIETGNKLRQLGAGGLAQVVQRFGQAIAIAVNMADTIRQMPKLLETFRNVAEATAIRVAAAMHLALNVLALIADAVNLVISLFGDWGKEGEKELKGMAKVIDEIKQASDQWVESLASAFVDFVKTGQQNWREFVQQILDDILRISTAELLIRPAVNFVGGAFFADGGAFDKGHIVNSPEWFATKQGPALRGEAGTEVVMPAVRLADGTLGVRSAGRGGGTVVNIIDQREAGAPPIETRRSTLPDGRDFMELVIRGVNTSIIAGEFDNALALSSRRLR